VFVRVVVVAGVDMLEEKTLDHLPANLKRGML
jgi:hypothetical protein